MSRSDFSVTTGGEAGLFGATRNFMASEAHRDDHDDPLEQTELARRLRRMEWPPAPREVKDRVLERIVTRSKHEPDADDTAPPAPAGD
jgi:hypothetical protein